MLSMRRRVLMSSRMWGWDSGHRCAAANRRAWRDGCLSLMVSLARNLDGSLHWSFLDGLLNSALDVLKRIGAHVVDFTRFPVTLLTLARFRGRLAHVLQRSSEVQLIGQGNQVGLQKKIGQPSTKKQLLSSSDKHSKSVTHVSNSCTSIHEQSTERSSLVFRLRIASNDMFSQQLLQLHLIKSLRY